MERADTRQFVGGMTSSSDHVSIQNGMYRSALGLVDHPSSNNEPFSSREHGTKLCLETEGFKIKGGVYANNNIVYAILSDKKEFKIARINADCSTDYLVESDCIKIQEFVDVIHRIRNGCENVLYFTDGDNPVMSINLDRLDCYKKDGKFDCDLMELFRPFNVPCIYKAEVIDNGGIVRYGSYNIAIQYLDVDLNPTNAIYTSSIITVSDDDFGQLNSDTNPLLGKIKSNKSIRFLLKDLDQRFSYYRVLVIERSGGTGIVSKYYASDYIKIDSEEFIFDGSLDGYTEVTATEVENQNNLNYRAKFINQIENRLLLSNIKGSKYDYCDWQKYASKIRATWVFEEIDAKKYLSDGMNGMWANTFMADEVIPVAIVYVDKRGNHHPAMHIPGAPLNQNIDCSKIERKNNCNQIDVFIKITVSAKEGEIISNTISANYFINSVERKKNIVIDFEHKDGSEYLFHLDTVCDTDKVKLSSTKYLENNSYSIEVVLSTKKSIFQKTRINSIDGWDDTVFPEWNTDMSHILSEDAFRKIIEVYNKTATIKVIYGDYSISNIAEIKKIKSLPRRYEIYNTALENGRLAYHQCRTATYTNPTKNCCDDFWGKDYCGNSLEGTPIRHVKMPDRSLIPLYSNGKLRRLGLQFDNIEYPHEDIVGHYIVVAKRDATNRTIIDKGIMAPAARAPKLSHNRIVEGFSYWTKSNSEENNLYVSPAFLLGNQSISGSHVKAENDYGFNPIRIDAQVFDGKGIFFVDKDLIIDTKRWIQNDSIAPVFTNIKIKDQYAVDRLTRIEKEGKTVINNSILSKMGFIETTTKTSVTYKKDQGSYDIKDKADFRVKDKNGYGYQVPPCLLYVAIKSNIDVFCSLDNITYIRSHDCIKTNGTIVWGDIYMTRMDFASMAFRKSDSLFKFIFGILGYLAYTYFYERESEDILQEYAFDAVSYWSNYLEWSAEVLSVYVESEYSWELRINGDGKENRVYRSLDRLDQPDANLFSFFIDKVADEKSSETENYFEVKQFPSRDFYLYNFDYSAKNIQSKYYHLPSIYNYCKECNELFPDMVMYSEPSFDTEMIDNYKVFKPNNNRRIPMDTGEITGMLVDGRHLYVFTTDALWGFPYGYQETVRDNLVTYIGDGAFFASAPQKILDVDTGQAGCLHRQSILKTPEGVFFLDEMSHKPFHINNGIRSISGEYESFFIENLRPFLRSKVPNHRYEDAYNIAAYDEINSRILFTKRDYKPLLEGNYSFDGENYLYGDQVISLDDKKYFKKIGWTISYSLKKRQWKSFHPYVPEYYLFNKETFFSDKNGIWSHNSEKYNHVYGKDTPFILELPISSGLTTKTINYLSVGMVAKKRHLNKFIDVNEFFKQAFIYNDYQCSGLLDISIKSSLADTVSKKIIASRNERNWTLNRFADNVTDESQAFLFDGELDQDGYYTDKTINDLATKGRRNIWTVAPFRDTNCFVRFYQLGNSDTDFIIKTLIDVETLSEY